MRTGRRTHAALAVVLLTGLGACSQEDADSAVDQAREAVSSAADDVELPDVDWDKYGDDVKDQIDELATEADCDKLAEQLTRFESSSSEVTDYIKAKLREANC